MFHVSAASGPLHKLFPLLSILSSCPAPPLQCLLSPGWIFSSIFSLDLHSWVELLWPKLPHRQGSFHSPGIYSPRTLFLFHFTHLTYNYLFKACIPCWYVSPMRTGTVYVGSFLDAQNQTWYRCSKWSQRNSALTSKKNWKRRCKTHSEREMSTHMYWIITATMAQHIVGQTLTNCFTNITF